jgi:hypothetical protein
MGSMPMDWTTFTNLVRLAAEFGPFLFALLFILIVPAVA